VRAFVAVKPLDERFVSTVTFAEIRYGIETVSDPSRRAELNDWLAHKVRPMFDQRVLEVSEDVMFKWRLLVEDGRKAGHTFSQPDLIIAATALHHGLTIVTRDTGDYMLSIGALAAEKDKPKENELRLTRTDRVTPAGAAGGSELAVSVRNSLTVIAQANPAL